MAQDNTVSFKAYLLQGDTNGKSEVRRFGIDRDVVSSFDYLKEKLQHVFPALRSRNFSIVWKDADNDDVLISSDDELMIALAEMQNEVRKLYIKVLGAPAHSPNTEAGQVYEEPRHKGVICDVCEQQIEGFRYHCCECFDYDLCGNCEAKKMHREHIMIRLPAPVLTRQLNPLLGRVISAHMDAVKGHHGRVRDRRHHHGREKWCHLNKTLGEILTMNPDLTGEMFCPTDEHKQSCSAEKGKQNVSAEEKRGKMKTKNENFDKKARGKKAEYMWSVGQKIAEFLDPWGIDVDVRVLTRDENENENKNEEGNKGEEKMETEEDVQNKDPKRCAGEGSNEAGPSQAPEACVPNTAAQTERANAETDDWTVLNAVPADQQQENNNPPEPTAVETSENEVEIETEKPSSSTAAAPIQVETTSVNQAQSGTGEPSTSRAGAHMFAGVGAHEMPSSGASAPYIGMPTGANGPIYAGLRTPGMPSSGSSVPMYAGLRTTGMPTSGANAPIHAGVGPTVPSATGSYYTNLYPPIPNTNLPQFYIQANQPVQPRQGYGTYTRPHVADAVQKMMAMGFSNEGGWLTQLLEIKNGDIEKALDVLQPVKRS